MMTRARVCVFVFVCMCVHARVHVWMSIFCYALQDKLEVLTHVELHLEETKSQLHSKEVTCSHLKDVLAKQKQSMMERASQVSTLLSSAITPWKLQ